MKRYAFVDVDMTIVDGNLGAIFAKELLKKGPRRAFLRSKWRFIVYLMKSIYVALLYPFTALYPVYVFLQDVTTDRFFDLIASWRKDELERAAETTAKKAKIPPEAMAFLRQLHDDGYEVVLLSASPSIVLKYLVDRLPIPLRFVGTDEYHREPMVPHIKAKIILEEFGDGIPAAIVGNPRREPFWLAKEKKIVVNRPRDLRRYLTSSP